MKIPSQGGNGNAGRGGRGWRVRQRGVAWQGMAKRPSIAGYETRTFHGPQAAAAAKTWAARRSAELRLAVPNDTDEVLGLSVAGRAPTADLGARMLVEMRRQGLSDGHCNHCASLVRWWAEAAPDLAAKGAAQRLAKWYDELEVAPATFNRLLAQGRRFATWLRKGRHLDKRVDLLDGIEPRKVPRSIKEQLTVAEVAHLLHQVDDHFWPVFALLVYTGTRISEGLAIRWEDIEVDGRGGGVVLLRSRTAGTHKTGERVIPLQPELAAILAPLRGAPGDRVVELYRGNAGRRFTAFLVTYGVDRHLTPHSTRHTYCGALTATGEPTALVAQYAGHSSEKQTMHYAQLATRHRSAVEGWARGQLCYLAGWASAWPRVMPQRGDRYQRTRLALRTVRASR